ncbi:MAG: hypothetical protein ABI632_12630 [Pseudolysinimonas sp.]
MIAEPEPLNQPDAARPTRRVPVHKHRSISISLPADLRAALDAVARSEATYLSSVIRRACVAEVRKCRAAQRRRERADAA